MPVCWACMLLWVTSYSSRQRPEPNSQKSEAEEVVCGFEAGTYKLIGRYPTPGASIELKRGKGEHGLFDLTWKSSNSQNDCKVRLEYCVGEEWASVRGAKCHRSKQDKTAIELLKHMEYLRAPEHGLLELVSEDTTLSFFFFE
eukprot:Gregarina_sp_Poly_1__2943@NODE_1822_length_3270_cov_42_347487_g1182_i0_p1_GENE_NODE_1822_length_3270_cov_42_347487_g1182_i0NODE_1822_length_3270_cov_42_347487_g1182_i0_p1_ORF_typecomplete_len143_score12_11_NODE_1822_length_3270_cov_42_347487_g1182_i021252553